MSEKEDLLNNLKIDRSQEGESEPFPTKIVSIIAAFVLVLLVGGWFFFDEEDIQEVTTFTVKSVKLKRACT